MSEFPRRNRIDQFTPAEKAIWDAAQAVENLPAHPRLTDAVVLLAQAREAVADYVDQVGRAPVPSAERAGERADQARFEYLLEALVVARDVLASFGTQAGYLPEQRGYSATLTPAEKKLADGVASLDGILVNLGYHADQPSQSRMP